MIEVPGYTVLRLLGHGGMATVYLALQQSLRREVALKILSPALAQDAVATERFLREARISAKLHHPHIVAIYDVGVHDGVPYMSIAYEPGGTVAQKTDTRGDAKFALRIVRDIAGALDYAHSQGVIHRDVKPENILLRNDGNCVLSDFGIAHAIGAQTGLTREGTSVGTPHYMSPEQLRGEHVDGRSDLYSLGVVFYQLLTGDLPYQGTDGWAIGMQHISAPIPRLPAILIQQQTFLDALLAKDPAARLQTGAEVMHWAEARLSGPTPAMTVAMATPMPATHSHTASGMRSPAASIAILPFADMSQGKDQEYLADGLSEELLNLLSKVSGLYVAGRSSAFSFKGKNAKLVDIGRELKVATVLEGSVRKFGERVRISVQLINVDDGFQMWSETYDRQLTDVFEVQDEIAALVCAALKDKLLPKPAPAVDPELARQLQSGRDHLRGTNRDDAQAAVAAFDKVLALDAGHAEAQAGRGTALQTLSRLDAAEAEQKLAREREAEEKAAADARQREAERLAAVAAQQRADAEKAAEESRQREAAENIAAETQRREQAERAAAEARQREAAQTAAAESARRDAEEKAAAEARHREAAEKAAAEARQQEANERAAAEARQREAEARAMAEARQREVAESAAIAAQKQEAAPTVFAPAVPVAATAAAEPTAVETPPPEASARARDPALEFASAYASTSKSKPAAPGKPAPKPLSGDSPPPRKRMPVLPMLIGGVVILAALVAWQVSGYFARQRHDQCAAWLTEGQTSAAAGDFDRAAAAVKDAPGVCRDEQATALQTLSEQIKSGQEKAQVCAAAETQARDLLGKGQPGQASELLLKSHVDCAGRPGFAELEQQPATAQSDANNLIVRATALLQANAVDDAEKLVDQAMARDGDVVGAQKLLIGIAAKRGKLGIAPAPKPALVQVPVTPLPIKATPFPKPPVAFAPRPTTPPATTPKNPARPEAPAAPAPAPATAPAPPVASAAPPAHRELVPISTPQPAYPAEALRQGVIGEVVVSFTVHTDGSVGDFKIVRTKPPGVFEHAVRAVVLRWRFQPLDQPQTVTRTFTFKA